MTNYITAVGSQQFSITIASGSLTGTATISAVGSGAFIIYGGINPSISADSAEQNAYLTLTNSTTITATRNTSTAGTVIVTGCIIDADTTNLIKSVQFGTVSLGNNTSSGTATITAVTNNNTAIHFLGASNSDSSFITGFDNFVVSLSGTTVTAARGVGTGGTGTAVVGFVAIEFQGSALNQAVQNVSASSSSSVTSWTATITSVNTSNSIIIYGGFETAALTSNPSTNYLRGVLTNGTTVTVNVNSASTNARTFNAVVVEFIAGLLNSNAQRGTTTLTAATSNTSTITSITATNSGINYLGNTATASTGVADQARAKVVLTNGTTVTTQKVTGVSNATSSWEVFEFPAFSGGGTAATFFNIQYDYNGLNVGGAFLGNPIG